MGRLDWSVPYQPSEGPVGSVRWSWCKAAAEGIRGGRVLPEERGRREARVAKEFVMPWAASTEYDQSKDK